MMPSYKGWFVFSQPLHLLVAFSGIVVAAIGTNILVLSFLPPQIFRHPWADF